MRLTEQDVQDIQDGWGNPAVDALCADWRELQAQVSELTAQRNTAMDQATNLAEKLTAANLEAAQFKAQVAALEKESADAARYANDSIKAYQAQVTALMDSNKVLSGHNDDLSRRVAALHTELDDWKVACNAVDAIREGLKKECARLAADLEQARKERDELNAERDTLRRELEAAQAIFLQVKQVFENGTHWLTGPMKRPYSSIDKEQIDSLVAKIDAALQAAGKE